MMGVTSSVCPSPFQIMYPEIVRRTAMEVQTMGNTSGGGIHEGRFFSSISFCSLLTVGRELSSGENTRDLNEDVHHTKDGKFRDGHKNAI